MTTKAEARRHATAEAIGYALRHFREEAGFDLRHASHLVRIKKETIERWECGVGILPQSTETLLMFARAYGVSLSELFAFAEEFAGDPLLVDCG